MRIACAGTAGMQDEGYVRGRELAGEDSVGKNWQKILSWPRSCYYV